VRAACREVQAQGAQDVIVTCGSQGVYHTRGTANWCGWPRTRWKWWT
jgi:fructose-1-phosphate kinase PfkB-like protein